MQSHKMPNNTCPICSLVLFLSLSLLDAQIIDMHISKKSVGKCSKGLVQDVDSFVINATVKLQRDLKLSDHVIFLRAEPPSNKFKHYFDINLKYKCSGNSVSDETLYCQETEPNVFSIFKTEIATARQKGAKVKGFITGEEGNTYCDEQLIPEIFQSHDVTPLLKINGREVETKEDPIKITTQDSKLNIDFTYDSTAEPCNITIQQNGTIVKETNSHHAMVNVSVKGASESLFTITYKDCIMSERNKVLTFLIKPERNDSLVQLEKESELYKTTNEMHNDESKVNQTSQAISNIEQIVGSVLGLSSFAFICIICVFVIRYYRKRKLTKEDFKVTHMKVTAKGEDPTSTTADCLLHKRVSVNKNVYVTDISVNNLDKHEQSDTFFHNYGDGESDSYTGLKTPEKESWITFDQE